MDRSSLDINLRILYLFFYVHGLNNALTHYHGHQQWRVDWIVRFEHQTTSTEAPPDSAGLLFSWRSPELVLTPGAPSCKTLNHPSYVPSLLCFPSRTKTLALSLCPREWGRCIAHLPALYA